MERVRTPPWRKKNPRKGKAAVRKLSPEQKAAARARAEKAGRPYPNLVDNMWAAARFTRTST
jgi:hypothetical protein